MGASVLERSYWLDTVTSAPLAEALELPAVADVAIVGAGFTGLSAALALAKRGAKVVVLERYEAGWGASSRNGGMALTGLKQPAESLLAKFGVERARRLFDASIAAIACVEKIVHDESIECDFARSGHLEVACKRSHLDGFRRTAETLARDFGHTVAILDKNGLASEIASDAYHGGLLDEVSGGLNPASLVQGLRRGAVSRGAVVVERTDVERIESSTKNGTRGFDLATSRGPLRAGQVFVATGAYTGHASPKLQQRVIPVGSYVIATETLDRPLASTLIPRSRMVFDSNNFLHYYRMTPDHRLLFGGRAAFLPANERTVRESAAILRRGMLGVFPQLRDASTAYAWGGTIDFTFDMLPHAGEIDGIQYALGYAGHGVAMATYAGTEMAGVISGEKRDVLASGPMPAAPLGLYRGTPWFLPIAGAWYKLLDWAS